MKIGKPMLKAEINITLHTAHATQQVGRKRINNARYSILSIIMVLQIDNPRRQSARTTDKKSHKAGEARI